MWLKPWADFPRKVETSVDGKRIVIDPDKNTLEMYTTEGHATLILRFDTSSDGWEYGDLILRKYVGDQLIQETTVYPERIRIQNHVENTDIILTPNNVSFYGSKGETLLVGMKPVYDGGLCLNMWQILNAVIGRLKITSAPGRYMWNMKHLKE